MATAERRRSTSPLWLGRQAPKVQQVPQAQLAHLELKVRQVRKELRAQPGLQVLQAQPELQALPELQVPMEKQYSTAPVTHFPGPAPRVISI